MRIVVLLAAGALAACAKPRAEKFADHFNAVADLLAQAKDVESARAVLDDLKELKSKEAQLRLDPKTITDEQQKMVDEAMERFKKELGRILRNPDIFDVLRPALPTVPGK